MDRPGHLTPDDDVRWLLGRIWEQLVRLDAKLDTKAEKTDVADLATRVDRLEAVKDRALGIGLGIGLVSGGAAGAVAQALLGG